MKEKEENFLFLSSLHFFYAFNTIRYLVIGQYATGVSPRPHQAALEMVCLQ